MRFVTVDLVRGRQRVLCGLLADRALHDAADVGVALVGDDALRVVVQLLFAVGDVRLDVRLERRVELHLLQFLFVPLKELDGVPAQARVVDLAGDGFLDVGDGVLDAAGEDVRVLAGLLFLRRGHGRLCGLHAALALERAHLDHLAAQLLAELNDVDLVAVLAHKVHHVDGHNHRNAQLDQLRGQVQVALDVRSVHDVEDRVRPLLDQVAARHDLLERVGRQGIDARQVLDDDVLVPLEAAFLLFHGHARPVAHVLGATRQVVEQRGLAAVRIARQGDCNTHKPLLLLVSLS